VNMQSSTAMSCPIDGATLVMSERQGIEIDYCPTCRGVWLDRGELDKIIERSADQPAARQDAAPQQHYQQQYQHQGHRKPRRKESWLSELFD
jgi:Zn-finger nucleic acid-binding protein